jgi:glucose-1-phosphatase
MIDLKKVDAIIFDLGGVILNIDYSLTEKAFDALGFNRFGNSYSKISQQSLFDDFETGKISIEEFRPLLKKAGAFETSDEEIDRAWNSMLLDLPPARLTLLESLKKEKPLFLLSNTNPIHINAINKYLKATFDKNDLSPWFNKLYLSHQVGMRKPHKEIFQRILDEHNLDAGRTMFIDDSIQHVEGARKAGLQAVHLENGVTILELF